MQIYQIPVLIITPNNQPSTTFITLVSVLNALQNSRKCSCCLYGQNVPYLMGQTSLVSIRESRENIDKFYQLDPKREIAMQITRQADYAVRAVCYLADLEPGEKATTKKVAKAQSIPPSFLAKIIAQLTVVGLLETTRGVHGGVSLARAPAEISLLDVVEAIDGPVMVNVCVHDHYQCTIENCTIRPIWQEAQADLVTRLKNTKFSQIPVAA